MEKSFETDIACNNCKELFDIARPKEPDFWIFFANEYGCQCPYCGSKLLFSEDYAPYGDDGDEIAYFHTERVDNFSKKVKVMETRKIVDNDKRRKIHQ